MVHQTSFISQGYSDSRYISTVIPSWQDSLSICLTNFKEFKTALPASYPDPPNVFSVTPLHSKLHCLPMVQRIEYTVLSTCYSVVLGTAPPYIYDLLELYQPSRSLHSAADNHIFRVPMKKKKSRGFRALSHVGPCTWNKLRFSMCHSRSIPQFKVNQKQHCSARLILQLPVHNSSAMCVCVCISFVEGRI